VRMLKVSGSTLAKMLSASIGFPHSWCLFHLTAGYLWL
jgi:hypothetical protein